MRYETARDSPKRRMRETGNVTQQRNGCKDLECIEATEEAIDNSLLRAMTVKGRDGHVIEALPVERLKEMLKGSGQ